MLTYTYISKGKFSLVKLWGSAKRIYHHTPEGIELSLLNEVRTGTYL